MAIDQHYIPAFEIETVILDKDTGAPLTGGLVYFERDNQRGTPKPVYQITGTSPNYTFIELPNPMELSAIGTFEDAMDNPVIPYFYPFDANLDPEYYFVRVTSSEGVEQFTRESVPYIPDVGTGSETTGFPNEISNPQFAQVFFDSPITYSFNAVTDEVVNIAPGWDLVVSAAAAATVTLMIETPVGSLNRLTNPGTVLNIDSTGTSSLKLRQRIFGSPNLWGSGFLSGSFVAKTFEGTSSILTLEYSQSDGVVVDEVISSGILNADNQFRAYPGSVSIPPSDSADDFPDAYVDIFFVIPNSTNIALTSVMVIPTGETSFDDVVYEQTSLDRQIDHMFSYFKPGLDFKPTDSYLVGWDFPLNPRQIFGASGSLGAIGANKAAYVWDQTIVYQTTDNSVSFDESATGNLVLTASTDTQVAIIQYLTIPQIYDLLSNNLSVSITCASLAAPTVSIALYYTDNALLPVVTPGTNNVFFTALDGNGKPTSGSLAAGWTELARNTGYGSAKFTAATTIDVLENATEGFSGWEALTQTVAGTQIYFAIVVGTSTLAAADTIEFNNVSLVPGDVPTRPLSKPLAQVIQECQYYYETSKSTGIPITDSGSAGAILREMAVFQTAGPNSELWARSFEFQFNTVKRKNPTVEIFSDGGTQGMVTGFLFKGGVQVATNAFSITNWTGVGGGFKGIQYKSLYSNTTAGLTSFGVSVNNTSEAFISFHFQADARLGIVP